MAKKPAESEESDETGSASESQSEVGSGSEAMASGSGSASESSEASDASGDETGEAPEPVKKGASARAKKATGKQSAVKSGARPAAAPVRRSSGGGHELVPVICSECYEELVFDSGVPSDVLTCPICEHQAARPDDAQLAVIGEKRKQEKTNFMIGFVLCAVSMLAFGVWIWMLRNPHTNAQENGGGFYGPMAVSLLSYIGCLAFTLSKYETARHDVYF